MGFNSPREVLNQCTILFPSSKETRIRKRLVIRSFVLWWSVMHSTRKRLGSSPHMRHSVLLRYSTGTTVCVSHALSLKIVYPLPTQCLAVSRLSTVSSTYNPEQNTIPPVTCREGTGGCRGIAAP
jgi:hypothetical protein